MRRERLGEPRGLVKIGPGGGEVMDKPAGEGAQQEQARAIWRLSQGEVEEVLRLGGLAVEQRLDGLGLERVELLVLGRLERGEISRRARPVPKLGAKLPPHPPKLGVLRPRLPRLGVAKASAASRARITP